MAFKALLPEECINSERAPILSEKQMRNTISYRRQCKMMELMHGHNLFPKRLPIGLEEQIKTFSAADLRKFYKKWYHPANMTIYIAGVFDMDVFMAAVNKFFGAEPAPDVATLGKAKNSENVSTQPTISESSKISNHADCQCRVSTSLLAQRRRAPGSAAAAAGEAAANPPKRAA